MPYGGIMTSEKNDRSYAFPVELRHVQTVDGQDVPRWRAVVRTDTGQPLSVVTDKYRLITHQTLADAIQPFIRELGKPEVKHHVMHGGATFAAEYVFRNHVVEVGGANHVAMRLLASNAYKPGQKMRLRVAALVLECLNCSLFAERDIFELGVRHVGDVTKFEIPTPEKVLAAFTSGAHVMQKYSKMPIDLQRGVAFLTENEDVVSALPETNRGFICDKWQGGYDKGERTVWDLLQHATNVITHHTPRLSYTGRLDRLQKTARLFNSEFAGY